MGLLQHNNLLNRVATVNVWFWVIKIISTTVGESSSDFFVAHFGLPAIIGAFVLLVLVASIQVLFKRYVPWMYWTVIVFVAVFGTMFADGLHYLGVPYPVTAGGFLVLLLATLGVWYWSENTLDVHAIHTTRRELFYWLVIFFTFAFGTAAGDLFASRFGLGYLDATLIFGAMMVLIPLLLYGLKINTIALFWITYVLTRPFGASAADLFGKPVAIGGLGFGDGTTALVTLGVVIVLVAWLTITHQKEMLHEERVA